MQTIADRPDLWRVYDCPCCGGWGWIATDGDIEKPRDCDNCGGAGLVKNAAFVSKGSVDT